MLLTTKVAIGDFLTDINKRLCVEKGLTTPNCWSNMNAYRFHSVLLEKVQCERAAFPSTKTDRNEKGASCRGSIMIIIWQLGGFGNILDVACGFCKKISAEGYFTQKIFVHPTKNKKNPAQIHQKSKNPVHNFQNPKIQREKIS